MHGGQSLKVKKEKKGKTERVGDNRGRIVIEGGGVRGGGWRNTIVL